METGLGLHPAAGAISLLRSSGKLLLVSCADVTEMNNWSMSSIGTDGATINVGHGQAETDRHPASSLPAQSVINVNQSVTCGR